MTDTNAPELKPCPFCGCTTIKRADDGDYEWMECDWCGATSGYDQAFPERPPVEQWNTRAAPTPPPDVAELVERLNRIKHSAEETLAASDDSGQSLAALANYGDLALANLPVASDTLTALAAEIERLREENAQLRADSDLELLDRITHDHRPLSLYRECDDDNDGGGWVVADNSNDHVVASGGNAHEALLRAFPKRCKGGDIDAFNGDCLWCGAPLGGKCPEDTR